MEDVLRVALEVDLSEVVICGYTEDGDEYFASSEPDGPSALWLLSRCQRALLAVVDEDEP